LAADEAAGLCRIPYEATMRAELKKKSKSLSNYSKPKKINVKYKKG
jgi:NRPS condensation-like uncharacterized protein